MTSIVEHGIMTPERASCVPTHVAGVSGRYLFGQGKQIMSEEKVTITVDTWLEASRMLAGAQMYRDYYATDLEPDELYEFDAIITKFQDAQKQLPEPDAETYAEWLVRSDKEKRNG